VVSSIEFLIQTKKKLFIATVRVTLFITRHGIVGDSFVDNVFFILLIYFVSYLHLPDMAKPIKFFFIQEMLLSRQIHFLSTIIIRMSVK